MDFVLKEGMGSYFKRNWATFIKVRSAHDFSLTYVEKVCILLCKERGLLVLLALIRQTFPLLLIIIFSISPLVDSFIQTRPMSFFH